MRIRLLRKLATSRAALGKLTDAEAILEEAQRIARDASEREEIVPICEFAGQIQFQLGRREAAVDALHRGLAMLDDPEQDPRAASLWNNLGVLAFESSSYEDAQTHHAKSLAIRESCGDVDGISRSLTNLGNVSYVTGNYDEASRKYQAALELKRRLGNGPLVASTLSNLAAIDHLSGRYGRAIRRHEEALAIRRERDDVAGEISSLRYLAGVWIDKGSLKNARRAIRDARALVETAALHDNVARDVRCMEARLEWICGRSDRARALARETLSGIQPGRSQRIRISLLALCAEIDCFAGGDRGQARFLVRDCLDRCRELSDPARLAEVLVLASRIELELGDVAFAEKSTREVDELARRLQVPLMQTEAHLLLGRIASHECRWEVAADQLHAALALAIELSVPEATWRSQAALGEFHLAQGRRDRALTWLQRAVAVLQSQLEGIQDPELEESYLAAPERARMLRRLEGLLSG